MNKKRMLPVRIILRIVATGLLFLDVSFNSCAQELKVVTRPAEMVNTPGNRIQRILIRREDKVQAGQLLRIRDTLTLWFPDRKPVKLPYRLLPIVSYDGNTIIQYGDLGLLDEPQRLDLFWIDSTGKEKRNMVNYYGGEARLDVSTDGFTAVGGPLLEKSRQGSVSLFSADGEKIWETALTIGRRISQLYTARQGRYIAAVTTDSGEWLKKHQLDIYGRSGKLQSSVNDLGIIQRLVLVGDESKIFFQGRDFHGLIDAGTGRVLWKNPGKVTMVSPYGASLSPDGKRLFLVIIQQEGKRKSPYNWKFLTLDATSGKEITSQVLAEKYPATWERIYESVLDTSVTLLAGDSRVTISVGSERGGRP
jgi:hypothetical protein